MADVALRVARGGQASGICRRALPWDRTAQVVSSCDCLTVERPVDGAADALVRLDLAHDPDAAKDFSPFVQLLDAAGAELARVRIDVEIGGAP